MQISQVFIYIYTPVRLLFIHVSFVYLIDFRRIVLPTQEAAEAERSPVVAEQPDKASDAGRSAAAPPAKATKSSIWPLSTVRKEGQEKQTLSSGGGKARDREGSGGRGGGAAGGRKRKGQVDWGTLLDGSHVLELLYRLKVV